LHRHGDQAEAAVAEVEIAGIGADGLHRQAGIGGALRQRAQQRGVGVQRDDVKPLRGKVQRDPPGPGADVQHRPIGGARQLAPERDVLEIATALDVVPDHRAHSKLSFATPRVTSSRRSSNMAV
jgi:hypothetical protein